MTAEGTESGHAAIELALAVGLLILPVAVLVLSLPTWVERQSLALSASREVARTVVLAEDPAGGSAVAADRVREIAVNHGLDPDDVTVCFATHPVAETAPRDCTGLGAVQRGVAITAYVTVRLPALDLPGLPGIVPATTYTARHTERVDLYRSFSQ